MHDHSVLFVDDEVNILKALQRLLRQENFQVQTASRPQEAMEILDRNAAQVIVTDQRMPDMSGVDLLSPTIPMPLPWASIVPPGAVSMTIPDGR